MNVGSSLVIFFTFFFPLLFVVIHPFIKKITCQYIFWFPIGIVLLIYLLVIRYIPDLIDYWKLTNKTNHFYTSKAFLCDLCPFLALTLCILMIVDYRRKIVSFIAPISILGGILTIFFEIIFYQNINAQFIFVGISPNRGYFMIHFIQVIFGFFLMLNTNVHIWKTPLFAFIFFILYLLYVLIVSQIFHLEFNVTGIYKYDWEEGEYSAVQNFLPLSYPWIMIVGFSLGIMVIYGFILCFYVLHKNKFYNVEKDNFKWKKVNL